MVEIWLDDDDDEWEAWEYEYNDNVLMEEETVFINEDPVAVREDYIEMGEELADAEQPPETEEVEWLSLGVFVMATSDEDLDPQMMLQLVLSKDGTVGGTYHHFATDSTRAVHGSLDKETQRLAFKIGEGNDNIVEAGLESLTRDEAPLWVHFDGGKRTQTWTLVRLEAPPEAQAELDKAKAEGGEQPPEDEAEEADETGEPETEGA